MPQTLLLTESSRERLDRKWIRGDSAETILRSYSKQVSIEWPSPKTDGLWELTVGTWVGNIPVDEELTLSLAPKTPIGNLFRMLEYAFRLKSFSFLEGLVNCASLTEFYERLASFLAKRVLDRTKRGLYREYVRHEGALPFVRGRMDVRRLMKTPWNVSPYCEYEEHTADIDDNQILAWSLQLIARSGMCSERILPTVRNAYRELQHKALPRPFRPRDCVGRTYNRLNLDYHPMHSLCRFFLEHTGPSHKIGGHAMLPFLVNTAQLFELFVAEWLKVHLPETLEVRAQEKLDIASGAGPRFEIDLVLYDATSARPLCVLDTKYKATNVPESSDLAQVVAYSEAVGCKKALLVYPALSDAISDFHVGERMHVRRIAFDVSGHLEKSGSEFLGELIEFSTHD